jgi:hypothetical protein
MRKFRRPPATQLTMWTAVALALMVSISAARAQIQTRGAAELNAQLQNATPPGRRLSWLWTFLPARNDPPLRAISMLVRALLLTSRQAPH